jgi:uncharacterized membrane protein YraQ (UPF0718 family)
MVSMGIKSSELSIKHLAKTFYLFCSKAKSKRFGGLSKNTLDFGLSTKPVLIIGIVVSSIISQYY